tara:strand:+ start:24 stop:383 length:360 start_codon:yes stop_codon:yes gene_type:complete
MKTFTEFKKHLQETKAGKEYKATDLDKQITQEIDAIKEAGDNEKLSELEAIRDEKDKEVKESRFKIYMNKKDESDAEDDPDADSVQESAEDVDPKDCLDMSKEKKAKMMEILRSKKKTK